MTTEESRLLVIIVLAAVVVAGLGFAWLAVRGRQRLRELAYQERIAMIEKGLVPSPETDPARFEALMAPPRPPSLKAQRYRGAGVILTGLGVAQIVLLGFVVPQIRGIAVGVGGAVMVIGLTMLANGLLIASDEREGSPRNTPPRG